MSTYDSARYGDTGEKMGKYTDGTLVVDMSDPIRLQAVWRSDYKAEIKTTADPQQNAALLKAAVQALFADFPPTTAASR